MNFKKIFKWIGYVALGVFIFINIIAFFHAYKFTHFESDSTIKTSNVNGLTSIQKMKAILYGIGNPKPINWITPKGDYETIKLKSNKEIECWLKKCKKSKGTVILFHGYRGCKSTILDKAIEFQKMNYTTLLVDFMGCGGSEGYQTTIGFFEAQEVKTAYEYVQSLGEKNIILFGTSMGAVAIMKAQSDFQLSVNSIIIECPFGTLLETAKARFKIMGINSFPIAHLLVFWGGIQNGFNSFTHNPIEYAKNIHCPTLLLYGKLDSRVSKTEIYHIYQNLSGKKVLRIYPKAGHENYLNKYKSEWIKDISEFLLNTKS